MLGPSRLFHRKRLQGNRGHFTQHKNLTRTHSNAEPHLASLGASWLVAEQTSSPVSGSTKKNKLPIAHRSRPNLIRPWFSGHAKGSGGCGTSGGIPKYNSAMWSLFPRHVGPLCSFSLSAILFSNWLENGTFVSVY